MKARIQELVEAINTACITSGKHKLVQELLAELITQGYLDHDTLHAFRAEKFSGKPSLFFFAMLKAEEVLNPRRIKPEPNEPLVMVREIKSSGKRGDEFILSADYQFLFGIKAKGSKEFTMLSEPSEFIYVTRTLEKV